ncbi:Phosphatidylinositol binding clathrin assembly protein 5a [Hibiscus trionum]|uniref:Phosphatidylinositol binding clathrin assembly protein 5a n=1 Tax=Hibiscus trionum TaxID=183268 RepID=A0A9W7J1I8_HIBTR|nr:Phosphatidylinositol binding clathrin assembly protein 5a [Hibiscus trionum]
MNKRFQQAFTALKEHTCVNYAKLATAGGLGNVDLILVKATAPNDLPLPDKYAHQLQKLFTISPPCCRAFSLSFARRFGKTRNWRVALKCLLLLHRLLRSLPEDSPFRTELMIHRSNGSISLHPCRFQDVSSSNPESFTMFIRSYAHLLDEISTEDDHRSRMPESSPDDETEETGRVLEVLQRIQSLIDRVMDCRPSGKAARSLLIQTAMKHIIRDSFVCYTVFRKDIVLVLENLFQMPYRSCISAFGIYKKAALQGNQLWEFYQWCKLMGVCGSYEYPFVDRIPLIQIQALESFIKGMWEMTDEDDHRSSSSDEDDDDDEEREPLIQVDESDNWEDILEASIDGFNDRSHGGECDEWMIQVYNPFHHAKYVCSDPKYPWGL